MDIGIRPTKQAAENRRAPGMRKISAYWLLRMRLPGGAMPASPARSRAPDARTSVTDATSRLTIAGHVKQIFSARLGQHTDD